MKHVCEELRRFRNFETTHQGVAMHQSGITAYIKRYLKRFLSLFKTFAEEKQTAKQSIMKCREK